MAPKKKKLALINLIAEELLRQSVALILENSQVLATERKGFGIVEVQTELSGFELKTQTWISYNQYPSFAPK